MLSSKASKVQIQQEPHDALKVELKLHMAIMNIGFQHFQILCFVCNIWGIFTLNEWSLELALLFQNFP